MLDVVFWTMQTDFYVEETENKFETMRQQEHIRAAGKPRIMLFYHVNHK